MQNRTYKEKERYIKGLSGWFVHKSSFRNPSSRLLQLITKFSSLQK